MKLPNLRRLITDDFEQTYQALVDKLALYINPNGENVYNALANRLTFGDNIDCTTKVFTVLVDANGIPKNRTIVKLKTINNTIPKCSGSIVWRAVNVTNSIVYPTGGVFLSFTQNKDTLTILHVAGLPAGYSFDITASFQHEPIAN